MPTTVRTYLMKDGVQLSPAVINTSGSMNYNGNVGGAWRINAGSGGNFSMGYYATALPTRVLYITAYCISEGDGNTGWLNFSNGIWYQYGGAGNPKYAARNGTWYSDYGVRNSGCVYVSGGTNTNWYIYHIWYDDDAYIINASSSDAEYGTVSGADNYVSGTTVTLTAIPTSKGKFLNWTKDGVVVSTDATYTFTSSADGDYVANFKSNKGREVVEMWVGNKEVTAAVMGGQNA